jgi:hypothetical protein
MSYNSLHVPLDIGTWQCKLVLAREFYSLSGGFWDPFAESDERTERKRQIEDDRCAFDRYFRPNYDFRRLITPDIDAICSFLSHHLNVAHWNLPTDNASIERALKQAVCDGLIVPVINRDWRSLPQTFRPAPAPLRWPPTSGGGRLGSGGRTVWAAFRNAGPGPLIWDGEPVLRGSYDPSTQEAQLKAARAAMAAALPDVVEAVASAALGGGSELDDDGDGMPDMAKSLTDGSDAGDETSTPLGDAQPFEYTEYAIGDAEHDAASFLLSPEEKRECMQKWLDDQDLCWNIGKPMGGYGTVHACIERARYNYNICMGFSQPL